MKYFFPLLFTFISNYSLATNLKGYHDFSGGLNCDGAYLKEGTVYLETNVFNPNENLEIGIVDIKGFTVVDSSANASFSMSVVNSKNDTLLLYEDNFSFDLSEKINIIANLQISSIPSLAVYENYSVLIYVKDKSNEKYLTYEIPFKIKHNSFMFVLNDVLTFDHIYVYNETKQEIINNNTLLKDDKYKVLIYGVNNFKEFDQKIYPKLLTHFSDKINFSSFNDPKLNYDLVFDKSELGVSKTIIAENPIMISLDFTELKKHNTKKVLVMIKVVDSKSEAHITVAGKFNLK